MQRSAIVNRSVTLLIQMRS